jgi:hypothetical protein
MSDDPPGLEWTVHDDRYLGDPGPNNYKLPDLHNSFIGNKLFHDLNNVDVTKSAGNTIKGVPLEHVNTFVEGYNGIKDAADDVAVGHHSIWNGISAALRNAEAALNQAIAAAEGPLSGATASAMFQKTRESLNYLRSLADAAERMDPLVDTFSRDVKETKDWFMSAKAQLDNDAKARAAYMDIPEDEARNDLLASLYNREAQQTIHQFYNPPIEWISQRHPDMSAAPPHIGGVPAAGGPSRGGGPPGGLKPGGLGAPQMPSPVGLGSATPSAAEPSAPTAGTDALKGIGDAAKGAGDAANGAAQQGQNALGQAANAANQALGQTPKGGRGGATGLPEGTLALGPKGLSRPTAASGGGARGGGAGGGGTKSPATSKPTAPSLPASKGVTAAQASRAGVAGGAGTPGAGAPVAGQRGAAGAGKEHKVSKALRHAKHGEDVIGETEGVVPVIGAEAKEATPSTPS